MNNEIEIYEIFGIIDDIKYNEKTPTIIISLKNNKKIKVIGMENKKYFFRKRDIIYVVCKKYNGELYMIKNPFVKIPNDINTYKNGFKYYLGINYTKANKIYNLLEKYGEENKMSVEEVLIKYCDRIITKKQDLYIDTLFEIIEKTVQKNKIVKWLEKWNKDYNYRKLYLLGLNNKEISSSNKDLKELYEICIKNPYRIPSIEMSKCKDILDLSNNIINEEDFIKGKIAREIYSKIHNCGWVGIPQKMIIKNQPDIKKYYNEMKEEYDIISEKNIIYLRETYDIQKEVIKFITNKVKDKKNNKEYIIQDDETCNKILSEDQKMAIKYALENNISIITGGAGTGKCHTKGTKILMYNGKIKKVENIRNNEEIMGPDGNKRVVKNICCGNDKLFTIIPKKGNKFGCNSEHMLTLKGFIPYYVNEKNLEVEYTINGKKESKNFKTKKEADNYIKTYRDIFDISLKDYLNFDKNTRRNCYMFHVPIEFNCVSAQINIIDNLQEYVLYLEKNINNVNIILNKNYKINKYIIRKELIDKLLQTKISNKKHDTHYIIYTKISKIKKYISYICWSLGYYNIVTEEYILIYNYVDEQLLMTEFDIKYDNIGKYYGFTLDNDGRYLLHDFKVTHNTTCIKLLIYNLIHYKINYAVCSFTGKAVSRIKEVTNDKNASTIHRLIKSKNKNFTHLVIDEASTITTPLFYHLIQSFPNIENITFVGDSNQLAPIGWGPLFNQLLKSETIPTVKLTTNRRVYTVNNTRDYIILNANSIINHNINYPFDYICGDNFHLFQGGPHDITNILTILKKSHIKSKDLMVISPYNSELHFLNNTYQSIFNDNINNPNNFIFDTVKNIKWCIGDHVMLLENNYSINVFNGEIGTIISVSTLTVPQTIIVDFDSYKNITFFVNPPLNNQEDYSLNTSQLIHSYAITVDKSQGSEWDFIILYINNINADTSFINRTRIYTAITRSKRCCWCIVNDIELFNQVSVKLPPYICDNMHLDLSSNLEKQQPYILKLLNKNYEMDNDLPPDDFLDDGYFSD